MKDSHDGIIPAHSLIKSLLAETVKELLHLWRVHLGKRLLLLEFNGTISLSDFEDSSRIAAIPNVYLRHNISLLYDEFVSLGYDCQFSLNNDDEDNWGLNFKVGI